MITIENLNKNNISEVAEIENLCIETPWGINELSKELENKNAFYACVKKDGKIIGYGGIWTSVGTADITNIAVLPVFRRMGIGSMIIAELIKHASEKEIFEINLEVNENNPGAIALYEKCHFIKVGIRKKYYNNKENALIMQYRKIGE